MRSTAVKVLRWSFSAALLFGWWWLSGLLTQSTLWRIGLMVLSFPLMMLAGVAASFSVVMIAGAAGFIRDKLQGRP